jgi:hypothetical protein
MQTGSQKNKVTAGVKYGTTPLSLLNKNSNFHLFRHRPLLLAAAPIELPDVLCNIVFDDSSTALCTTHHLHHLFDDSSTALFDDSSTALS